MQDAMNWPQESRGLRFQITYCHQRRKTERVKTLIMSTAVREKISPLIIEELVNDKNQYYSKIFSCLSK